MTIIVKPEVVLARRRADFRILPAEVRMKGGHLQGLGSRGDRGWRRAEGGEGSRLTGLISDGTQVFVDLTCLLKK